MLLNWKKFSPSIAESFKLSPWTSGLTPTTLMATLVAVLLAGCSGAPPRYAPPTGEPLAYLGNQLIRQSGDLGSINVYIAPQGANSPAQRQHLFTLRKSAPKVESDIPYLPIAAHTPYRIFYEESPTLGSYCHLTLDINLEPGQYYALVGGSLPGGCKLALQAQPSDLNPLPAIHPNK